MKKLFDRCSAEMIRPAIYRSVLRGSIALAAALLWDRYVNIAGFLSMRRDAFLVVGAFFLVLAWFAYLKLDGVQMLKGREKQKKRKPLRHSYGDLVDFADEHIVSFDELDEDQQTICSLLSDLFLGILFLVLHFF